MEELLSENNIDMPISDSNADKLVNRIDKLLKVIEGKQETSNDPVSIVRIEKDLTWHARIGWIAISVTGAALASLFSFVLLRLPRTADVQNVVSIAVKNEVSPLNDKISAINEKLAGLTATIEFLKPDVSKNLPNVMKQSLQQKGDLELGLKTLAALATRAQEQKITTDPVEIGEVVQHLLSIKDRNIDFWRASSSLLNYRSFNVLPKQTISLSMQNLPNCTDSDPVTLTGQAPYTILDLEPTGKVKRVMNPHYYNCRFTLDSAEDDRRINSMVVSKFPTIEFRHCLIVYKGGDFALITESHVAKIPLHSLTGKDTGGTANYNGPSLQFIECLFDFSVSDQVPERGQEITQNLLAQNGLSLIIPLGKDSSPPTPTHN